MPFLWVLGQEWSKMAQLKARLLEPPGQGTKEAGW